MSHLSPDTLNLRLISVPQQLGERMTEKAARLCVNLSPSSGVRPVSISFDPVNSPRVQRLGGSGHKHQGGWKAESLTR